MFKKFKQNIFLLTLVSLLLLTVPAKSSAVGFIDGLLDKGVNGIMNVFKNVKEKGIQTAVESVADVFTFGLFSKTAPSIAKGLETKTIPEFISDVILSSIEHIATIVVDLNNVFFSLVFSELVLMLDYQNIPEAGIHIKALYNNNVKIASWFFVAIVSIALLIILLQAKLTKIFMIPLFILFGLAILCGVLMTTFPSIFSFSQRVVNGTCAEILSYVVNGERIKYDPEGLVTTTGGKLEGFKAISNDLRTIGNLPQDAIKAVKDKTSKVVNEVSTEIESELKDAYKKNIEDPINESYKSGIDSITKSITGIDPNTRSKKGLEKYIIPPKSVRQAGMSILKIIIAFLSLSMSLTLICMKIFQTVMLLVMLLAAPFVLIFILFPLGFKIVLKFFIGMWALMAWNIGWAICIKVYFITQIIFNAIGISGDITNLTTASTAAPLHGLFGPIGVLVVMTSISTVVGWVAVGNFREGSQDIKRLVTTIPSTFGGFVAGAATAAVGVASGGAGLLTAAGAFIDNPKATMQSVSGAMKAAGGIGQMATNPSRFLSDAKTKMMSDFKDISDNKLAERYPDNTQSPSLDYQRRRSNPRESINKMSNDPPKYKRQCNNPKQSIKNMSNDAQFDSSFLYKMGENS